MSKKTEPEAPMSQVLSILVCFLATIGLFITAIFVDKPASTVATVTALVLLALFFILCYKLGKHLENQEKADALDKAKAEHPAGAKRSSTFSVLEPPTDATLNHRYVEGSIWNVVDKSGQGILKRYTLTDNVWVNTPITKEPLIKLDVSSMSTVEEAAKDVQKRISRGDYGENLR